MLSAALLLPFLGTTAGALCVFALRGALSDRLRKTLLGLSSGVMTAASVWSLLIPAMDQCAEMGRLAFLPAAVGCALGFLFLLLLDQVIPHLHADATEPEGPRSSLRRTTMLCLAVTLHNIPEGMAVGAVLAAFLQGGTDITGSAVLALSLGIALQNFPEGAVVSMPLAGEGNGRAKSFLYGMLSGIVEPLAAIVMILLSAWLLPALPYLLAAAAGAMLYVVFEELIPEASGEPHSNIPTLGFAFGFLLMMALDVALA